MDWIFLALAILALVFFALRRMGKLEAIASSVAWIPSKLKQDLPAEIITKCSGNIEQLQSKSKELLERTTRFEESRWISIGLLVHGMKDPSRPERTPRLGVIYNVDTCEMRPMEERFRWITAKEESVDGIIGTRCLSLLGAPAYQKLNDREIVVLGVVYTVR